MGDEVVRLGSTDGMAKSYRWILDTHGLEMGTGVAGTYERHAHRHYVDLVYSPGGLSIPQITGSVEVVVVQPGVRFGPIVTDDFFFVKFLPSRQTYSIPDKVVGSNLSACADQPAPSGHAPPWRAQFSYYAPTPQQEFRMSVCLTSGRLRLVSSADWRLSVER